MTYGRPRIMGILNLTPDSFSDGGKNLGNEVENAFRMIDEGADIIDIGGESTRPLHEPVSAEEEIRRILPTLKRLSESASVPLSVDTMKPEVAQAAIDAGADIINDVTGMRDPRMREIVASSGVAAVIMHMYSDDPAKMHVDIMDDGESPLVRVMKDLSERVFDALESGIDEEAIIIDPGFGFGKTNEQNITLLENLELLSNRFPILAGVSRKRFLAEAFPTLSKDDASVEAARIAVMNGANIVRVHDVLNTRRMLGIRDEV